MQSCFSMHVSCPNIFVILHLFTLTELYKEWKLWKAQLSRSWCYFIFHKSIYSLQNNPCSCIKEHTFHLHIKQEVKLKYHNLIFNYLDKQLNDHEVNNKKYCRNSFCCWHDEYEWIIIISKYSNFTEFKMSYRFSYYYDVVWHIGDEIKIFSYLSCVYFL
jgi:hypothetical protein